MESEEKRELLRHFTDKSRHPAIVGKKAILPKLFEDDGELRTTWATPDSSYSLSFAQLHFLKTFENTQDLEKSCFAAKRSMEWGTAFLKKHQDTGGYLWEKQKIKQLATVATPEWTKAKAVEGVMGTWRPDKAQVECLKIVKDINYPKAALTIQNNAIFKLPELTPEQESEFRKLADTLADVVDSEASIG